MDPLTILAALALAAAGAATVVLAHREREKRVKKLAIGLLRMANYLEVLEQEIRAFSAEEQFMPERKRRHWQSNIGSAKTRLTTLKRLQSWADDGQHRELARLENALSELDRILERYNNAFVQRRLREHHRLLTETLGLDEEQRLAVVRDDERNLVIAGAGSGKTRTLTARVVYLTKCGVPPSSILAVTFTKKARGEMEMRLRQLNVPVEDHEQPGVAVMTLHALGNRAVAGALGRSASVADEEWTAGILAELLRAARTGSDAELGDLYLSAMLHFHRHEDERRPPSARRTIRTLKGEHVRSYGERIIADFLYTHHIDYRYEAKAAWAEVGRGRKAYHPDFYLPAHELWIEHWGIDRRGGVAPWVDLQRYQDGIAWKREQFHRSKKRHIETWYYEQQDGKLEQALAQRLKAIGVPLRAMTLEELLAARTDMKYVGSAIERLLSSFISNARSLRRRPDDIRRSLSRYSPRVAHFGRFACACLRSYERRLEDEDRIDFANMLHQAADALEEGQKVLPRFQHVLVDEFQDTSPALARFIKALVENDESHLFVVGDDWQAIYGWAGGDVSYLLNFEEHFGPATTTLVRTNYRSPAVVVEAGAALIARNTRQVLKEVVVKRPERGEAWVYEVPDDDTSMVERTVALVQAELTARKPDDVLVVSRTNHVLDDIRDACRAAGIHVEPPGRGARPGGVRLLSAHKSKGLEAPAVIVVNASDHIFGFPSKVEDPDVLEPVRLSRGDGAEEERRLFYVALTRAEERLHILTRHGAPSPYIAEIEGTTAANGEESDPGAVETGERFEASFTVERLISLSAKQQAVGIRQSGILSTRTTRVRFTSWAETLLQPGATYRLVDVLKEKPYRDLPQMKLDASTRITLLASRPTGKRSEGRPLAPRPPASHRPRISESQ